MGKIVMIKKTTTLFVCMKGVDRRQYEMSTNRNIYEPTR
ncbi:unnamed protein product [Amaranthus hypochondriacus]